jgi:hypothetical protein
MDRFWDSITASMSGWLQGKGRTAHLWAQAMPYKRLMRQDGLLFSAAFDCKNRATCAGSAGRKERWWDNAKFCHCEKPLAYAFVVFLAFELTTDNCNRGTKCAREAGNSEGDVHMPRENIPVKHSFLAIRVACVSQRVGGRGKKHAQSKKSPLAKRRYEHREWAPKVQVHLLATFVFRQKNFSGLASWDLWLCLKSADGHHMCPTCVYK